MGLHKKLLTKFEKRRVVIALVIICIILIAVVIIFSITRVLQTSDTTAKIIPTEQQALTDETNQLVANPPNANTASEERAAYYKKLAFNRGDLKNYTGAIRAFEQYLATSPLEVSYRDYIRLAGYYHAVGDKKEAVTSVDKAIAAIPPVADSATSYYPEDLRASLENVKQEYAK